MKRQSFATALALFLSVPPAATRGQDVHDDTVQDLTPAAAGLAEQGPFVIDEINFYSQVYGAGLRQSTGQEELGRSLLKNQLDLKLKALEKKYGLGPDRRERLELAARSDIQTFLDRVDVKLTAFRAAQGDQGKVMAAYMETRSLGLDFRHGVFNEGSVLEKALPRVLDPDDAAALRKDAEERKRFLMEGRIRLAVNGLAGRAGLSREQRERLLEVSREAVEFFTSPGSGRDADVIAAQLFRLPEARFRSLFRDDQWKALEPYLIKADRVERSLVLQGALTYPKK